MALGQVLIDAVTYALAGAAIEPVVEPMKGIAAKAIGAGRTFANRVAAAHAGISAPTVPSAEIVTGSWLTEELKRFERANLRPIGEELQRFERTQLRPIGEWITEHPCESAKMAMYLALGLGNPTSALAPCPTADQQAQVQRAQAIRYALLGGAALVTILLLTRKKRGA